MQALTGLELTPDREIQALDGKTWNERCRELGKDGILQLPH